MSNGMELEIRGKDELTPVLRATSEGYEKFEKTAVESTNAAAAAAERASKSMVTMAQRMQAAYSSAGSSSAAIARNAVASTNQFKSAIDIADDYASALEAAQGAGREYAEAMEEAASRSVQAAQRSAVVHESFGTRVARAFEAARGRVRGAMTGIQAAVGNAAIAVYGSAEKIEQVKERISKASEDMQRRVTRAFKTMAVAVAGFATASAVMGASFEQSMAEVGAATSATPAQLASMTAEAQRWGTSTRYSAKEVADAMKLIGQETGSAAETMKTIGPVITLAGATQISLAEATDVVAQAMDAFSLAGGDAARIVDVLVSGAKAGSTGLGSFRAAFAGISTDAGQAGLSIEQTAAILAAMTKHGATAGQAVSSLRTIIAATQNPTDKVREAMGGLTIQQNGMYAVIQRLISTGPGLVAAFGDARKFAGLSALAKEGPAGLAALQEAITGTSKAEEMFARNQESVAAKWGILVNTIKGIGISVFQQLSGVMVSSLDQMKAAADRYADRIVGMVVIIRDWVVAHQDQIGAALKVALVIGAIVGSLAVLATATIKTVKFVMLLKEGWLAMRVIGLTLGPIFTGIAEGIMAMGVAIVATIGAGPALLIAISAALIGIGVWLWKTNDTFRAWVHALLDGAKRLGAELLDHLTWPFRKWIEYAGKAMSFLGDLFPGMKGKVQAAMDWIGDKAGSAWQATSHAAAASFGYVKDQAGEMRDAVGGVADSVKGKLTGMFSGTIPDMNRFVSEADAVGRRAAAQREFKAAGSPSLGSFARQAQEQAAAASAGLGGGGGGGGSIVIPVHFEPTLLQTDLMTQLAQAQQAFDVTQQHEVESAKAYTAEWLGARMAQINTAYQREISASDVTAESIAAARISRDAAVADAMAQNMEAALAHEQDLHIAALTQQAASSAVYTEQWLSAREALINASYERDTTAADVTATRIAELTIQRDADMSAAIQANHDAIYQHWMATHQEMVLVIGGLSAAYDTAVDLIIRAETNLKKVREALWMSFKRSVITGAAQMFKAYLGEQLKALIIGHTASEKIHAKEKLAEAKLGAVKAYQAFAFIPFIGPALGAAAAAAAFAFLVSFHTGGYVDSMRGFAPKSDERLALLQTGEYVMQRRAVENVGTSTMDYINRNSRLPETGRGAGVVQFNFNITGSGDGIGDMKDYIEEEIVPRLEAAMNGGRFRGRLSPARSTS